MRAANFEQTLTDTIVHVDEGGTTDLFLFLTDEPINAVDVSFDDAAFAQLDIEPDVFTVGTGDWDTPRALVLSGIDDGVLDDPKQFELGFTTFSADTDFSGAGSVLVELGEAPEIRLSETSISVVEGDAISLSVSLNKALRDFRDRVVLDLALSDEDLVTFTDTPATGDGFQLVNGEPAFSLDSINPLDDVLLGLQTADDDVAGTSRTVTLTLDPNQDLTTDQSFAGAPAARLTIRIFEDEPVAPDAIVDRVLATEDEAITIDVLANDIDHNLTDVFTVTSAVAANGTVVINDDNTITYTPDQDFNGPDIINYQVTDQTGLSDSAPVEVFVEPVNDLPVARYDLLVATEDETIIIDLSQYVTDVDGDQITYFHDSIDTEDDEIVFDDDGNVIYQGATAQVTSDGIATITLPTNYFNTDVVTDENGVVQIDPADGQALYGLVEGELPLTFTYAYRDTSSPALRTGSETIQFMVVAQNDPARTRADTLSTDEDSELPDIAATLLANDADPEGDDLTITSFQHVSTQLDSIFGQLADFFPAGAPQSEFFIGGDGQIAFIPSAQYQILNGSGFDTVREQWTYKVEDSLGARSTGTVEVEIAGRDDPSVGAPDTFNVTVLEEGSQDEFVFGSITANDFDIDFQGDDEIVADAVVSVTALGARFSVFGDPGGEFQYLINDIFGDAPGFAIAPGEVLIDTVEYTARSPFNTETHSAEVAMVVTGAGSPTSAGVILSRDAAVVQEGGASSTFWAVLSAAPTSGVVLSFAPSDATEVALGASSLTFTPDDWNVARQVTIDAVEDELVDGPVVSTIDFAIAAAPSDPYNALAPDSITVTTLDRAPGIRLQVTESRINLVEGGAPGTALVSLGQQPTGDVVLSLSSSDQTVATLEQATLRFTAADWDVAQQVRVLPVDDAELDGLGLSTITIAVDAAQSASEYAAAQSRLIGAFVADDEAQPAATIPPSVSITARDAIRPEGTGTASTYTFLVSRAGEDLSSSTAVNFAITGAAIDGADADDFAGGVLPSGRVTLLAGQSARILRIEVASDAEIESDEGFAVTISPFVNGLVDVATAEAVILDDDDVTLVTPPDGGGKLRGTPSDDRIEDGPGFDLIFSLEGRDVIVLSDDGVQDVLKDFVPGVDYLDVSAFAASVDDLQIANLARASGEVRWISVAGRDGETELLLRFGDETPLDAANLGAESFLFASAPLPAPAPNQLLDVAAQRDDLRGTDDDDVFVMLDDDILDVLRDFDLGSDRIDVSAFATDIGDLELSNRVNGRGEIIWIDVADATTGEVEFIFRFDADTPLDSSNLTESDFMFL